MFCREVEFVEIYAFLANFFLAKNVSLLFLLLFASLLMHNIRQMLQPQSPPESVLAERGRQHRRQEGGGRSSLNSSDFS